ncbi:hypothetical protein HYW35_03780, partial [Candidatus Saccharibacteria bacterium]|nr:hypothetical protein [Candidatus Saccharibacteria bacterium]
NIGNNGTAASTSNINIGSSIAGTTAITGATTVTNRTSGAADSLAVSNSTSTGNIAVFKDNTTTVLTIANGGAATFQNQTDSTAALQIQNSAGVSLLTADSTNLKTELNGNLQSQFGGLGRYQNMLTYSEQGDNAAWTNGAGNPAATRTADTTAAPNGETTADTVDFSGGTVFAQGVTTAAIASRTFTFSIWIRATSGFTLSHFGVSNSNNPFQANYTQTQVIPGDSTWHRYSFTFTAGAGDNSTTLNATASCTGGSCGTATMQVWGAQLEENAYASIYARVGAGAISTATRGIVGGGNAIFNPSVNSTTAFQIQNAAGQNLFVANTTAQQVAIGPAAVPANGVLTIGTNTTAATGGLYFGTDTNLYRAGSGVLTTDSIFKLNSSNGLRMGTGLATNYGYAIRQIPSGSGNAIHLDNGINYLLYEDNNHPSGSEDNIVFALTATGGANDQLAIPEIEGQAFRATSQYYATWKPQAYINYNNGFVANSPGGIAWTKEWQYANFGGRTIDLQWKNAPGFDSIIQITVNGGVAAENVVLLLTVWANIGNDITVYRTP